MEMKAEMGDDILALAQRRRAGRMTSRNVLDSSPKRESKRLGGGFPSERVLRIDNFITGPETPSPAPSPVPFMHSMPFESNISEVAGRERNRKNLNRKSTPMFADDMTSYSRNLLPPLINIEVQGQEIPSLINTSSHISLISTRLVNTLGLRKDLMPDKTVPPSPLNFAGSKIPYLIEGKIRYIELTIKGTKYVTQLHVARDLPSDLVLGVDFLKKTQIKINFQDSSVSIPSGANEVKLSFLSNRELDQSSQSILRVLDTPQSRAYSSNF